MPFTTVLPNNLNMTSDLTDYVNTDSMFECIYVVSFYRRVCKQMSRSEYRGIVKVSLEDRVIWCC